MAPPPSDPPRPRAVAAAMELWAPPPGLSLSLSLSRPGVPGIRARENTQNRGTFKAKEKVGFFSFAHRRQKRDLTRETYTVTIDRSRSLRTFPA